MRGSTAEERRSGHLQRLAYAGLVADDACLSTFSWPELSDADVAHLDALAEWLARSAPLTPSRIERSYALHDTDEILSRVAELTRRSRSDDEPVESPEALIEPIRKMVARTATQDDVFFVRAFSEILSRVTLMLTEQLANEKDTRDWTTKPLSSSQRL